MNADSVVGWSLSPWFLVTAPQRQHLVVHRPRVVDQIDNTVSAQRVVNVTAPAGYGKTVAVSEWARQANIPVAWLTLTRFDDSAHRIYIGVVSAFRRLAEESQDRSLGGLQALNPDPHDLLAGYLALEAALSRVQRPLALVIDDVHLAGTALSSSIVGRLAQQMGSPLRIVLVGAHVVSADGDRTGDAEGRVGSDDLAFDRDDVIAVASALGEEISPLTAETIVSATSGWPAAVRLRLIAGDDTNRSHAIEASTSDKDVDLADFVANDVLSRIEPDLADFLLATTTCSRVNVNLAALLSGRQDSESLLEECVQRGLFLDRFLTAEATATVYRWHSTFADRCRQVLNRRDPKNSERLNRIAARALAEIFPLEAVHHAFRANDPSLAAEIITAQWIGLVIQSKADALDRLCVQLPEPFGSEPTILLIRACCHDVNGDRAGASRLYRRAVTALVANDPRHDQIDFIRAVSELFITDDHADLMRAVDAVRASIDISENLGPQAQAWTLFLIGWTELRLRRAPARAIQLLQSSIDKCESSGGGIVAQRARANMSFALAFGGHFSAAETLLADLSDSISDQGAWRHYDGGIESMAAGYVAFWRNDLDRATTALRRVVDGGGGDDTYAALARIHLVLIACIRGDRQEQSEAERGLRHVSDVPQHGVNWDSYKLLARCKLAEARDKTDEATDLARSLEEPRYVPVTAVMLAETCRRANQPELAEALLQNLGENEQPAYIAASALLTRSLIERRRGNDPVAHRLMERSLDAADAESVARPYSDNDPELQAMLIDHATWGTQHGRFLAELIAQFEPTASTKLTVGSQLSRRELEVLDFMRSSMTTVEIADALFVSINTVKTHQRAIYRKLGVTNRRDALKVPM